MSFSSKPTKALSFALIFALLFNVVGVPSALASAGVAQQTAQKSKLTADIGDLPDKLPSSRIELPSKRTEYTTRYLNPDGSFTEEIFNEPQFYQDSADKSGKILIIPLNQVLKRLANMRMRPTTILQGLLNKPEPAT